MAIEEIVTKIYRCDLCDKEVSGDVLTQKVTLPVKFLTEQTEGRAVTPYITHGTFDLCNDCLEKAVTVVGQGAQGYNKYWLKN